MSGGKEVPGRRRVSVAFVVAAMTLAICASLLDDPIGVPPPPLRIGHTEWLGYSLFSLAGERDYLDDHVAVVRQIPSTSTGMSAFRHGILDMVAVTLDECLRLAEDVPDLAVVLVLHSSAGADALLGRPGIEGVADLKGRRVGVEDSAVGGYLLERALEQAGMDRSDIVSVALGADQHEAAFLEGRVDAVVTFEPMRSRILRRGAEVLYDSTRIPGGIVDVLVTRRSVLERRPSDVKAVLDAWFRAVEDLHAHHEGAIPSLARTTKLGPEEVRGAFALLDHPDRAAVARLLTPPQRALLPALRDTVDVLRGQGLLVAPPEVEGLLPASLESLYGVAP